MINYSYEYDIICIRFCQDIFEEIAFVYMVFKFRVYNDSILNEDKGFTMKHQNRTFRPALPYAIGALILTVLLTALRCVNLFFFFDAQIGYHTSGAPLPILTNVLSIAALLAFGVLSVWFFRGSKLRCQANLSLGTRLLGGLCGLGFLFLSVYDIITGQSIFVILFGQGAALYFLTVITGQKKPLLSVVTGLCAILRLVTALASAYFNVLVQMNAPDKLIFLLGCLSTMLFLVCELRATVSDARPILYRFSAASALLLTAMGSLPSIIGYHAGLLDNAISTRYLLLVLCLYIGGRLLGMTLAPVEEGTVDEEVQEKSAEATDESAEQTSEEAPSQPTQAHEETDEKDDKEEQS